MIYLRVSRFFGNIYKHVVYVTAQKRSIFNLRVNKLTAVVHCKSLAILDFQGLCYGTNMVKLT